MLVISLWTAEDTAPRQTHARAVSVGWLTLRLSGPLSVSDMLCLTHVQLAPELSICAALDIDPLVQRQLD